MRESEILVAAVTATLRYEGRRFHLARGQTLVRADDPVVKGREGMFKQLSVAYLGRPVEQATAAPGERRDLQLSGGDAKPKRTRKAAEE